MKDNQVFCVLGATGRIGIELTASLLSKNLTVRAVVRDKTKLLNMLKERGISADQPTLSIFVTDLFSAVPNTALNDAFSNCSMVFNCASPKISWVPLSKVNRQWGTPVLSLTRRLIEHANQADIKPHVFTFIGPEYFGQYDAHIRPHHRILSKLLKAIYPALKDNYLETNLILDGEYKKWTVLRCGGIRPGVKGRLGNSQNVGMDYKVDGSNYKLGKGYSLQAEDLAAYLTSLIENKTVGDLEAQMPFTFNTHFSV
ncbi:SDR family oxidoreductase [Photobacterium makurazakiensis]|uniref:NAD(P)-binding oxidoreductase n=1 Tax=Photobacterium makurazakiensis TaxID=2910234 RepID=UPI003D0C6936